MLLRGDFWLSVAYEEKKNHFEKTAFKDRLVIEICAVQCWTPGPGLGNHCAKINKYINSIHKGLCIIVQ